MRQLTILLAALALAACGVTGKDVSVAEYESHLRVPFNELMVDNMNGGAQVVVVGKSNEEQRDLVARAVEVLNAALPACARLTFAGAKPSYGRLALVASNLRLANHNRPPHGYIYIEFTDRTMQDRHDRNLRGRSYGTYILLKQGRARKTTVVHELVHSMGVIGHVPDSVRSVMTTRSDYRRFPDGLSKSDKAVLQHIYNEVYPCQGVSG